MGLSPHTKNRTEFLFLKTTVDYWEWEKGQAEPIFPKVFYGLF